MLKPHFIKPAAFYLFLAATLLCFSAFAQERTITGKISDAQTKAPLSSGSVYSLHTGKGVISDENGSYNFTIFDRADSIAVSMVGYTSLIKPISKDLNQVVNFEMQPAQNLINEVSVVVKSKYTKAQRLIVKVIKNRDKNDVYQNSNFQCQVYDKIELDVKNIPKKLQKNKLFKPFAFILDNMDSTKDHEKYLPVYLSESIAKFSYKKNPEKERYDYEAIKSSGLDNASLLTYIDGLYKKVNVYSNFIKFVDISFLSPIGADALDYYAYTILDTMVIDNHSCIQVHFSPARYGTNTFEGNMWIADSVYAIKSIVMHMDKASNINWVTKFEITQEFEAVKQQKYMPEKNMLYIDLKIPAMKTGALAKKTTLYKNFSFNTDSVDITLDKKPQDIAAVELYNSDTSFWQQNRFEPLTRTERSVYKMMDTLSKIPQVVTYQKAVSALSTGYYTADKIDIGNVYGTFTSNVVEGTRFNIGAKTNYLLHPDIQLRSYFGYATKDKQFRYLISTIFVLNRKPWTTLFLRHSNDIASTYDYSDEFDQNSLFSSLLRRVKLSQVRLVNNKETSISFKKYYHSGLGFSVNAKNIELSPFFNVYYSYGKFIPIIITKPGYNGNYKTNEVAFTLRYFYKEKYVTQHYFRGSLGSNYPVVAFTYTKGFKTNNGVFKSDFDYHKWDLSINHDFNDGHLGQLSYALQGNIVKGILPILLLDVHKGNDTYYYNRYAFNNMNRYEFVSDRYVSLSVQQIFGSFPFNYIPVMKKWKWRSLITFKGVLGGMSEANKVANSYYENNVSYHFTVPDKTPYMEAGVGIENIFHLLRIDAVRRLNYLSNPGIPKLGLKASLQFKF